jgi:UDP-N-acetylglucosamine--N-acetylmuramyl-(pentapeptide) pyrophosphoryl-undecaprenol N-acetylglucosamine transferase
MVMAGGTGGHVFPGLAVADLLRVAAGTSSGWAIRTGMEAKLVPSRGYEMAWVRFGALRGKGLLRKLLLPLNLLSGFWQAARDSPRPAGRGAGHGRLHQLSRRHDGARCSGGRWCCTNRIRSPAWPTACWRRSPPACLSGFPEMLPGAIWAGNPVRTEIAALPTPAERYAAHDGPIRVLVLGGSLGAAVLNETVPKGLALIPDDEQPQVVHQSGEKHLAALQSNYSAANVAAHCVAFIDDMAGAYDWADLVVCRAGALTVAELAAAGVASVLVPFPHAVDDHQTSNARFLSQAGGAILLPQAELTPEKIALIRNYSREQLQQMAERARELAKPDATEIVAMACMELVK